MTNPPTSYTTSWDTTQRSLAFNYDGSLSIRPKYIP